MNDSNLLNGGQVIIDYLIQEKVPYMFGLCGHGNIGLIDAMHERADEISTISVHHESVSGFMADVYYRVSGQPTATFTHVVRGRRIYLSVWPMHFLTQYRFWQLPVMCQQASLIGALFRKPTAIIRQIFHQPFRPIVNVFTNQRAVNRCH